MGVEFAKNTYVHGHGWFGPDYPGSEVTPEVEAAVRKARGETTSAPDSGQTGPRGTHGRGGAGNGQEGGQAPAGPPPKAGAGATTEAWAAYARSQEVEVPDGVGRAEIIAALETANVPTE